MRNYKNRKQVVCVILGVCVSLLLTSAVYERSEVKRERRISRAQESLAEEVFRFHVLANSDSTEDQNLKLVVRDAILAFIEESFLKDSDTESVDAEVTKEWVYAHLDEIEQVAYETVCEEGYAYPVEANAEYCYFPDRKYGNVLFPKGYYEALRVEIGNAQGHNWWCVLYPSLCFTDATCAVVTEQEEQKIEGILCADDYEVIYTASENFRIKSFFLELFKEETLD